MGLAGGELLHDKQESQHEYDAHRQGDEGGLHETGHNISDKGDDRTGDGVGKLRGHVVHVVALSAGRGHDGGVGDGGAVVAAHSARHAGGDADDAQGIVQGEDVLHDGDQDAEGAPAGAGRKGNKNCNAEDDQRHKVHQAGIQIDGRTYKGTDTQGVRHTFQSPGQH